MEIVFNLTSPSLEQYFNLFETTGWNHDYQATQEELFRAISNSQYCVAAYNAEKLIGFGRILTDGVLHAIIFDLIVQPEFQLQGIGTMILQKLIEWCNENHIRDIQLFCASGKQTFYEKNGFVIRPSDAPGMQFLKPN
ncbi:MAG: GNAT family N-acetyltransferase [Chloroflexota bacterium]